MESTFDTNKQPGFHILISLIQIWTPTDKTKPNEVAEGEILNITEVQNVEIKESFKQLIGTATVQFPPGTIIRKTITPNAVDDVDYKHITVNRADSGVIEEKRSGMSVAEPSTFAIGQRIKIYLGYTTDPKIAQLAKMGNGARNIYNNKSALDEYMDAFYYEGADAKRHMSLMFDGYISKVSVESPIVLECENLAYYLRKVTCPVHVKLKSCTVKDLLGANGRFKLLENSGLKLHSDTEKMTFNLGAIEITSEVTVADVLKEWANYGLFAYVSDDNGEPAIQIARAYFSNPGKDSILNAVTTPINTKIHFDYHVANNNLSLTSRDIDFIAVQAKGFDAEEKQISLTLVKNNTYNGSGGKKYRCVNKTTYTKKKLKKGLKKQVEDEAIDLSYYTQIAFFSKNLPTTIAALEDEAWKYLENFIPSGIEGSIELFGDLRLRTAQHVELVDRRYPAKEGTYMIEEVTTKFGTNGFRQTITIPHCIKRKGNKES